MSQNVLCRTAGLLKKTIRFHKYFLSNVKVNLFLQPIRSQSRISTSTESWSFKHIGTSMKEKVEVIMLSNSIKDTVHTNSCSVTSRA